MGAAIAEMDKSPIIAEGRLIGLFSFDVGHEIDLDRARSLTAEKRSGSSERRRAAPASLAYATPPLSVPLGNRDVALDDGATLSAVARATVHDFGAVSIILDLPLRRNVSELPALTAALTGAGALEVAARDLLAELFRRLAPAILRPALNPLVEDYYVIQVDACDPPTSIPDLVAMYRAELAAALRCEPTVLSEAEAEDVFRARISYYPNDLLVTEWNVALIIDPDYADALSVLEYLNVQLVELRFYDASLDRHITESYGTALAPPRRLPLLYGPHRRAVDQLAAIRLDAATIFERVHNALKLSGSVYLAKVYTVTAERLGLEAWEKSVERKLEVLQEMYDILVQRVATARAELLEVTIVILIVIELVVLLAGWG